jgi:SulP family sulfate permease
VLRLRGRTALGATSFAILADYAQRLAAVDGRLFLSGVDPQLFQQLRRTRRIDRDKVEIFTATPTLGDSSRAAYEAASRWVESEATSPATRIG